jgi:hypothetical protein
VSKKVVKNTEKDIKELEQKTEQVLKQAEEILQDKPLQIPNPIEHKYVNPPPQGSVAKFVVRTQEQVDKLDAPLKAMLCDPAGKPLPEWVQVARMFNRPHKKVAIVGFADTRMQAPYNDPTYEIWGLNDLHASLPRYDRWFDIHSRSNIDEDVKSGRAPADKCGLGGLRTLNVPIYMQERYEDIPNSVKFPLQEIIDKFGNYFTNSISYMTALAIFEGFNVIDIYGVDMAVGTEYVNQRPSCEYFIGLARGRGIKVFIPPASDLCKCRFMYAFEEEKQHVYNDKIENMLKNMQARKDNLSQQKQQMIIAEAQYDGAIGATKEIQKIWANLEDKL